MVQSDSAPTTPRADASQRLVVLNAALGAMERNNRKMAALLKEREDFILSLGNRVGLLESTLRKLGVDLTTI